MGNTLNKVVNFYSYEYTFNNGNDILRKTQELLKKSKEDKILLDITKTSLECDSKGDFSTIPICKIINKYKSESDDWIAFSNDLCEENMSKYKLEEMFINLININKEFIKSYIVEEEINTVWIVVNELDFELTKKYIKTAREFKEKNNCDFNIVMFEEDEIEDIEEQLKYIDNYKEIVD